MVTNFSLLCHPRLWSSVAEFRCCCIAVDCSHCKDILSIELARRARDESRVGFGDVKKVMFVKNAMMTGGIEQRIS